MNNNRRDFMKALAVAGIAGNQPPEPICAAARESYLPPVVGGIKDRVPVLGRKTGLKIKSVETFTIGTNLSFVRVRTDDGAEGYGQISPYDADISATILHRKIARLALGQDPADIGVIVDRCIEENYKFPWSFVCRALTGLDTALWDLLWASARERASANCWAESQGPFRSMAPA